VCPIGARPNQWRAAKLKNLLRRSRGRSRAMIMVPNMDKLRSFVIGRSRFDVSVTWNSVVKRTIGRFVRGNISAQNQRVLLPDEQKKKHEKAKKIAEN
jgi:hypothetical protein